MLIELTGFVNKVEGPYMDYLLVGTEFWVGETS